MFSWLADRFVLAPSRHAIEISDGKQRRWVPGPQGKLAVWEHIVERNEVERNEVEGNSGNGSVTQPFPILVLKFPGTGGRAENSTIHPVDAWNNRHARVWTINPPGYGESEGRPSLKHIAATAEATIKAAEVAYPDHRWILCGNSLGNLSVCYVAARFPLRVMGLLMRNPPPLRDVIRSRHPSWKTLFLAHAVAASVPAELSTIQNAAQCMAPALFITSANDQLVFPPSQQRIFERYAGTKRQLLLEDADHADPVPDHQVDSYRDALCWLLAQSEDFARKA